MIASYRHCFSPNLAGAGKGCLYIVLWYFALRCATMDKNMDFGRKCGYDGV